MKEGFDVAVVGAGPAGISAAYVLASAGMKTIVFERGEYPGAKNMSGGVLYGHNLAEIMPDYLERHCPVERSIIESRLWYLGEEGGYSAGYRDAVFAGPRKHNAFTVGRSKFDRWYAEQAAARGALIVASTAVEDLLRNERGGVVGVATGRKDGEVAARVTVLADGINSPLAAKTGFRPEVKPEDVALAVKEIIDLPADTIQHRFAVAEDQGVTTEILGTITRGMDGIGVLYTNQASISLAVGARLSDFAKHKIRPYDLMEAFKQHPMVASLISGGKPREYIAHWLPEAGYDSIPSLYGDGFVIAGDSAMLFNALHREGNNLAMTSGKLAAETIIEAFKRNDFSRKGLADYGEKLAASYVLKDLKKYRKFGKFLYRNRELFNELPQAASSAAREMLTVDGVSKKEKQKLIRREMSRQGLSTFRTLRLLWRGWRAVK